MTIAKTHTAIPTASRVHRFTYAIRQIVAEAQRVEATGTRVRYLNIGDPVAFGFKTPPHLIETVTRALRDGYNSYRGHDNRGHDNRGHDGSRGRDGRDGGHRDHDGYRRDRH